MPVRAVRLSRSVMTGHRPSALGGLAGDAEPDADLGPGVAVSTQSEDGVADGVVELGGEVDHVGEGFDVAGGDTSGVGADNALDERGVFVVLDDVATAATRGPAVA